MKNKFT